MGWSINQKFGMTFHRPQLSSKGYTLITPLSGNASYLLDIDGRFVHKWVFETVRPHISKLLDNGNLLMMGVERSLLPPPPPDFTVDPPPFERHLRRLGANCSVLQEITWEGEVVWEHKDIAMHHDFVRLENGNTIFPVWREMPDAEAKQVKGGVKRPKEKLPVMLGDDIVEIDPKGKEVWRAETWKLFDPRKDPICPLETKWEWTHINSIDLNSDGDVLISCRNNSRVAIISRGTGDPEITWKYGFPDTAHQHHATWVDNNQVQIFDNGMHRQTDMSTSRVIVVDPQTSEVTWTYQGNPPAQFFSGHISGATRLPNQNVLICEGTSGRLLEITSKGEVAWEWWNPIYNARDNGITIGWLFRAYRYGLEHPAIQGRQLQPENLSEVNRQYGM